ncbi:Phage late control gene D protein (GPD) [Roseovarius albus]|uniref:Phage late control gene D protein (GPD) n=1 Tax=Roseovarius albus TaxID=1247867 RepID=A0A1X6ZS26_9RHOB|nr:hypothetical protein [Roseovarius albus]SLN59775.1 Phage late control gene D protein (GPD) [Roseovarius albus]
MLDQLLGAHMTLLIGQGVPRPASALVMEHFASAEIAASDSERSGFELVFEAGRSGTIAGAFPIMAEPGLQAGSRVVITATIGIRPNVLMDGIIEQAEFTPAEGETTAKLAVRGKDMSFVMDREEVEAQHPAQGPGEIAALILLKYTQYGVIPTVIPPMTAERPNPLDRVPMQRATDFAYLTELAEAHDAIFTLIPGPLPLTSTAYWGPKPRLGAPQAAITTDMGPETNVSGLNIENAESEAGSVSGQVQDRQTGQTIPVQSVIPLRPPLAARPALANGTTSRRNLFRTNGAPTAAQAMGEAQAQSDASLDTVTVTGDLDTAQYGAILTPRGLVGLRGAGFDHDGFYYVQSVIQKISRGTWTQSFTLNREGVGTTTPIILP